MTFSSFIEIIYIQILTITNNLTNQLKEITVKNAYYEILRVSNKHLERNLTSSDSKYAKECAKEIQRRKMVHLYIAEEGEWDNLTPSEDTMTLAERNQ